MRLVTAAIAKNEAQTLADQREFSDYFEALIPFTDSPKTAANWLLGPVRTWLNEHSEDISNFPIKEKKLGDLSQLVKSGKVNLNAAKEIIFPRLCENPEENPETIAKEHDLIMESAENELQDAMKDLIEKFPDEVKKYRGGKKNLVGFFVGQLMRQFKGKANPKEVNEVVRNMLES